MERLQFRPGAHGLVQPLLWVLPTFVLIGLIGLGQYSATPVPAPFLILIGSVVVAGAFGGVLPGLLAGGAASLFLLHATRSGFAPNQVTDGFAQVVIGSAVFFFLGGVIGHFKFLSDRNIEELRKKEKNLRTSLEREILERVSQTARNASNEEQLRQAVRISGIGHFRWNLATGVCEYCSDQHAAHFGLTAERFMALTRGSRPTLSFVHPDDHETVLTAISKIDQGTAMFFEFRAVRPDGEVRFLRQINEPVFDGRGRQTGVVGSSIDLTDLREAEARVRQSQRIEVIGTLTGGVAHDFNNLLAIILGNLELSLELREPDEQRALIREAIKATYRGADLTKNLLSFARRAHLTPTRLNLNKVVQSTMEWGYRVMPATISIENTLMTGLWDTDLDRTSVQNAIINILLNARDAMPEGGQVTIETSNLDVVDNGAEGIAPGRYVMLAISDTGHGIEADKLRLICEPFYSDKPPGSGSGLGLSMVQGFIEQSGGTLQISSEVGAGTTVKLFFKAVIQAAPGAVADVPQMRAAHGGGARILVAEDEQAVSQILCSTLESAGYDVTTAADGDTALEIFRQSQPFDLVLTDIVMPGRLQGPALVEAVRAEQPDIPCVFLSGYAEETTAPRRPADPHLMKPVGRLDLLATVSAALQARASQ
ncbi:MAG: ATP-binding protein [Pseudomonadota bacterium]